MPFSRMIPTLMYHSIDDRIKGANIITSERFIEHMEAIRKAEYQTISLELYSQVIRNQRQFQDKFVLLTFDDGYDDFYYNSWPILREYDATATVFLTTSFIGQLNWWNHKSAYFKRHLSWEQIAELKRGSISFGGHSTNHQNYLKFNKSYIWNDMTINKSEIEYRIESSIYGFSYPYGDFNNAAKEVAKNLYDLAFSVKQGHFDYGIDRFAINRFDVQSPKFTGEHLIEVLDCFSQGNLNELSKMGVIR